MPLDRPTSRAVVLSTLAACLLGTLLVPLAAEASGKTTICHRTSSAKNPYRRITVSQNALAKQSGHKGHTGAVWQPGATPKWGDVVPDGTQGGSTSVARNWTAAGQAVWHGTALGEGGGAACGRMTALRFYEVQKAAGVSDQEIVDDLNEQEANEDAALLAALGGAFTLDALSRLGDVRATTSGADAHSGTTATLTGSVSVAGATADVAFVSGTDPSLRSGTLTTAASPASVTGTTSVSAALTDLAPGTQYWFKVVATTEAGTDAEGVLEGDVLSFTTPAAGRTTQTIDFPVLPGMVVGTTATAPAPTATSGLPVVVTSTTPSVCSVAGLEVTPLAPGTCALAADQPGDATYAPASQVVRTAVVRAPQTIVFEPRLSHPAGTTTVALTATSTSGLPVGLTVDDASAARCSVDGATVTVSAPGTCTVHADQPGSAAFLPAARVTRTLTVAEPVAVTPSRPEPVRPTTPMPPAPVQPAPDRTARPELPAPPVQRVGGRERTETAAQLAEDLYPQPRTAKVVVLARSDVYADGLTGSPLAGTLDGPVLLTEPEQLSEATSQALRRVLAADGTVYVLGGPRAVSPEVAAEVARMGYRVTRIGGVDRYDTATLIADRISAATTVEGVYLATGVDFPDALSAASAAEVTGGVVLLTRGARMPAVTSDWLSAHDGPPLTAVGGAAAAASPRAARIVGSDRYSTAAMVAQTVLPEAEGVVMVTGTDFPDGLAGASYAARNDWSMLLVDPRATTLTPGQDEYLGRLRGRVEELVAIGGAAALPPAATALVSARLDRPRTR